MSVTPHYDSESWTVQYHKFKKVTLDLGEVAAATLTDQHPDVIGITAEATDSTVTLPLPTPANEGREFEIWNFDDTGDVVVETAAEVAVVTIPPVQMGLVRNIQGTWRGVTTVLDT